ncbi:MAG: hypothetical protein WKH68_08585 [Candidatus Limnocylindria bacterium]
MSSDQGRPRQPFTSSKRVEDHEAAVSLNIHEMIKAVEDRVPALKG